jgi:hypothetical protein
MVVYDVDVVYFFFLYIHSMCFFLAVFCVNFVDLLMFYLIPLSHIFLGNLVWVFITCLELQ